MHNSPHNINCLGGVYISRNLTFLFTFSFFSLLSLWNRSVLTHSSIPSARSCFFLTYLHCMCIFLTHLPACACDSCMCMSALSAWYLLHYHQRCSISWMKWLDPLALHASGVEELQQLNDSMTSATSCGVEGPELNDRVASAPGEAHSIHSMLACHAHSIFTDNILTFHATVLVHMAYC